MTPRPVSPPEPTAVIDWLRLYVIPLGIRVRVQREACRLVRLEHLHPGGGKQPQDRRDRDHTDGEQRQQLAPAETDEEEHGEQRSRVHERRSEVRLHEHEQDRSRAQAEHREDRLPARDRDPTRPTA